VGATVKNLFAPPVFDVRNNDGPLGANDELPVGTVVPVAPNRGEDGPGAGDPDVVMPVAVEWPEEKETPVFAQPGAPGRSRFVPPLRAKRASDNQPLAVRTTGR
jgi:hypothetical protein